MSDVNSSFGDLAITDPADPNSAYGDLPLGTPTAVYPTYKVKPPTVTGLDSNVEMALIVGAVGLLALMLIAPRD